MQNDHIKAKNETIIFTMYRKPKFLNENYDVSLPDILMRMVEPRNTLAK